MASAFNYASEDSDSDIQATLNEINGIYVGDVEMFKDDEVIPPDCAELERRVESRAASFSSDQPEPGTSSRSSERAESVNLEEADSWEKESLISHFSTSSQLEYSSESSEDSEGSERSSTPVPSISRVRLVSSSSEEFAAPSEHPVDPMESLNEDRGLLNSSENSENDELVDSLESSDSDSTDDDTLLASNEEHSSEDSGAENPRIELESPDSDPTPTDDDTVLASNEEQVTQNSEVRDVDAIAEHDHLFNVRVFHPEGNVFESPVYGIVHRSAMEHSLVGFTYKWSNYINETTEVCLLQFCSVEGLVIFHKIRRDHYYVPPLLEEILSNENIRKVGIFPGPMYGSNNSLKNALDLRYALQICGMLPEPIQDIVESLFGYSVNMYRGTRPTDKYLLETDAQYRTAFLEVYFGLQIFMDLRTHYNIEFNNNFDHICEIRKDKMFRMGRHM